MLAGDHTAESRRALRLRRRYHAATHEAACTYIRRFSDTSTSDVAQTLGRPGESAGAVLDAEGLPRSARATVYQADVRYHGQGFEVPVAVDLARLGQDGGIETVRKAFDEIHRRLFTFNLDVEHEFVNLRAFVQEKSRELKPARLAEGGPDPGAALKGDTTIWARGRSFGANLYDRARLLAHNVLEGPAIVTEMDSTTLILPGHSGEVDSFGNIRIRPKQ
jgi:N-methylhydantoinase A